MTPRVRKFALTAHVISSVGWLGAIVAFLALAIVGLTSDDAQLVRAVYLTAEPLTWFVIVPAALAVGFCIAITVAFCIATAYLLLGISRSS